MSTLTQEKNVYQEGGTPVILEDVSYQYSVGTPFEKTALDHINLRVRGGAITGLIGHTGSGKSTLVQLLNGLLKPSSGIVRIGGRDIWEDPKKIQEIRFRVGLVFQYPEYQLFEETVEKDIAYGPSNMGLDKEEIARRVRDAVMFCGLGTDVLDKSPFDLSGGQKRRAAIAGIIAMEPEVLILDEPAAGLDPMGREEILGGVWSYQRRRQGTVIIVSHSMEDMARYCDDIIVMDHGRVFMQGPAGEIFRHADALTGVGLDIPQVTRVMKRLRAMGADVREDIFTVDAAREELERFLSRKGGGRR